MALYFSYSYLRSPCISVGRPTTQSHPSDYSLPFRFLSSTHMASLDDPPRKSSLSTIGSWSKSSSKKQCPFFSYLYLYHVWSIYSLKQHLPSARLTLATDQGFIGNLSHVPDFHNQMDGRS